MRSIDEQNRPGLVNHPINTNDDEFDHDSEYTPSKLGRPHKLQPLEQFFLVLCRLKRGFSECHLGNLYGVSQSTISRIFVRWINFMYLKLDKFAFGQVDKWCQGQCLKILKKNTHQLELLLTVLRFNVKCQVVWF